MAKRPVEADIGDDTPTTPEATAPGFALGTVGYMSPEQAKGETSDARSDQFSFGTVLYELFSGQRAFARKTSIETLAAIIRDEPEPLPSLNPSVPPLLVPLVKRCLAKEPDARYPSTRALALELANVRATLTGLAHPAWPGDRLPTASATAVVVPVKPVPSIAVLPFADMSPKRDQEYFCEGMAEELISDLTAIDGVRVVSRTAAFQFKGKDLDVREIGRRLGVATILEGSVRKAGNRLRITVQMSNVADGFQVWSERYDRTIDDVFALQDEIGRMIVDKLKVKLIRRGEGSGSGQAVRRHTDSVEAYQAYLRGRHSWNKRTGDAFEDAVGYFRRSIDRDPTYALPYAGLADTYCALGYYNTLPPKDAFPKAKAAATKALDIDSGLAEAHASLGFARLFYDRDWADADAELRHAIELNPQYATAHQWQGWVLLVLERFDEALVCFRHAYSLDPLSLVINDHLGYALTLAGLPDQAMAQLHRAPLWLS